MWYKEELGMEGWQRLSAHRWEGQTLYYVAEKYTKAPMLWAWNLLAEVQGLWKGEVRGWRNEQIFKDLDNEVKICLSPCREWEAVYPGAVGYLLICSLRRSEPLGPDWYSAVAHGLVPCRTNKAQ